MLSPTVIVSSLTASLAYITLPLMLRIIDTQSARESLLKRTAPDELPVPSSLLERIATLFGEALAPAQAVERILKDVRQRGDIALREWTAKLDGVDLEEFYLPRSE